MIPSVKKKPQDNLTSCRETLQSATDGGDEEQISMAMANLGFALFQERAYQSGLEMFEKAVQIATKLDKVEAVAQCLGIKVLAFQEIGRLPDAFETAGEVLRIAEETNHPGMKCDALASQAQLLADSGEPTLAFKKISEAREAVEDLDDKRRLMNVLGVLGNINLGLASPDSAEDTFNKAAALAGELGDRRAECGFLGNKATLLAWHGEHARAAKLLERVLPLAESLGDREAEINALHQLTKAYSVMEDHEKTIEYAGKGVELSQGVEGETAFAFYEAKVMACYRTGRTEQAHTSLEEAIRLARATKSFNKEIDLLLSLGESYMVSDRKDKALDAYKSALAGAKRLSRQKDEAYLTGRVGIALAELGQLDAAATYHQSAIELARQADLQELEGEQLSMLAMACLERQELKKARAHCHAAIETYAKINHNAGEGNARRLLSEIDAADAQA
jgi:tetratricopeptide (TPR) repeat protein